MSSDSEEDTNLKEFLEECVDRDFARSSSRVVEKSATETRANQRNAIDKHNRPVSAKPSDGPRRPSKRALAATEWNDNSDGLTSGMKTFLAKQLDNMIEKSIKYRGVEPSATVEDPVSEVNAEGIKLFSSASRLVSELVEQPQPSLVPRKMIRKKPSETEKITQEDLESVAVSADWVLNKRGIYGKGREKQGEVITGAVHAPSLSKQRT